MPHRDLLAALLPPVSYDAAAPSVELSLQMEGRELDRVQADGARVLGALRPFVWQQWLPDWERVYGLPGPCAKGDQLLQVRMALLALAFQERGGISRRWLKRYALLAGYEVDIAGFRPFRAGHSQAGDPLTNGPWIFAFQVTATGDVACVFKAGQSPAGDALRHWGDPILECVIAWRKPAHAIAIISYATEAPCTA